MKNFKIKYMKGLDEDMLLSNNDIYEITIKSVSKKQAIKEFIELDELKGIRLLILDCKEINYE